MTKHKRRIQRPPETFDGAMTEYHASPFGGALMLTAKTRPVFLLNRHAPDFIHPISHYPALAVQDNEVPISKTTETGHWEHFMTHSFSAMHSDMDGVFGHSEAASPTYAGMFLPNTLVACPVVNTVDIYDYGETGHDVLHDYTGGLHFDPNLF